MLTAKQCQQILGDPIKEKDMVVFYVPEELQISCIPKRIYCNKRLREPLSKALAALIMTGCIKELKTWDGCFNIRNKRGAVTPSLHSWGLAIDVNAGWNRFGMPPNLSPRFVKCFTDNGFDWGGTWAKPDGMHFQLADISEAL